MRVFKFGGASLRNADGVKNVASIIHQQAQNELLVVVSAMGKTTDMLERIHELALSGKDFASTFSTLKNYHAEVISNLFTNTAAASIQTDRVFTNIASEIGKVAEPDQVYDQIVAQGEILSSIIVHYYLVEQGIASLWIDAREHIETDSTFREGKVNWERTTKNIAQLANTLSSTIIVTQGFIGRTPAGFTTTLGREGSDFTAAIFASCLSAESLTIWKDVAGVMNADPRRHPDPIIFDELPFREAAEMTYYGASVIHPKTIKPLANKGIPLLVKNFQDPSLPGTRIHECQVDKLPPLIVFKPNQCLISCKVTDYTFISEHQLHHIFETLLELDIRINVMQNSAITFSFCIDFRESKVTKLIQRLQRSFEVYYNTGLTLITVKNYDTKTFEKYRTMPGVLLEQSSRSTLQVLVRTT